MLSRRILIGLLALTPAACLSPNPSLYTLAVVPGADHAGAPRVIELRAIAVAHYLERSQIVRSSENLRLDVIGNDWWGEPLDAMLGRVLSEELTQRLPGSTVYGENGAISANAGATVAINVQRLDADASGAVVLIAQIAVSSAHASVTRTVRYSVMPIAPGTPGLVDAMSAAIGQLADTIAGMVAAR
ncbi:MAG TPA: PqiC family protein [Acetobacteraceae bacterium]|nr:PqiC family protein [Acetobacteraceae bacterium]